MINFNNDYCEGMHQNILNALYATNEEQTNGYGEDPHTLAACELIRQKLHAPDARVFLVAGGTQANVLFISHNLLQYQAVISAVTGHINVHETGAVEAAGHKIFCLDSTDGKITPDQVRRALAFYGGDEHMVEPAMVYLTNPTELGAIYHKSELQALYALCREKGLCLYIDGARLASALTAEGNDVALSDYQDLCDAFYIGGTKAGALFGEAIVVFRDAYCKNFRFSIKQKGALLAKGRMLGIQFEELFKGDLYLELGKHANVMADILRKGLREAGHPFYVETVTNQVFPVLPDGLIEKLRENYVFSTWEKLPEGRSAVRFVTSWLTKRENAEQFVADIKKWTEKR